ncbi:MAG: AAA family ATPase [Planctomycetaceae bacterium]|nr:AAA family ATPase [Planctomycetales bacterium]MCB9926677.1 AAA family ATPase [Planctomycetaceae bacterium]
MKISDIHIDGFGVWNTMSADGLSPEVTLFYGPNEAGKTTLMQFVRTALYGFSQERRHLYLPPVFGGIPGGMLRVENHSGEFTVERRLEDDDQSHIGRAVVLADNGSRHGQHLLNSLLCGIDETIFNNVFAVGIRELQELATLNDTQAAEQLYDLASGVDRVSLVEVMRHLQSERLRIWQSDANADSELARLMAKRHRLHTEIEGLEQHTRRWADLAHQQRVLVNEIDELEKRIASTEFKARTVEVSIQVREKWKKRAELTRQIARIGHVEPLPEDCVARLDEVNEAISVQHEQIKPIKQRRLELRREMAAQPINKALWERASRIEAICEHGPWLTSLDREIRMTQEEIETSEVTLMKHDEELATNGTVALADGVVVSQRTFQHLLAPAHSLREAYRKREIAKTHHKKTREEKEHALDDLQHELNGRSAETFEESLDRAANTVKLLRRRIQIEERVEALESQNESLEQDNHILLDQQFQRVRMFAVIGVIFSLSVAAILAAAFGENVLGIDGDYRWGIGLLGALCTIMAIVWKANLERMAQDELDECFQRREALTREIANAIEDREEIARQLPTGVGTFETRLIAAERELKSLEEKVPLQQDRQQAERRTHESKRYATSAEDELKEAKSRWKRALRSAGLPESLSPTNVKHLSENHEKKSKIQVRLDEQRERLEKLVEDRESLVERLQQLNNEIGIESVSDEPHIQLSQLAAALAGQREMVDRRRALQKAEKDVRKELDACLKNLRRLHRSREALFAEARVMDEDALRERAEQLQLIDDLSTRRDSLSEQIQAIIGTHCSQDDVGRELEQNTSDELESRWNVLLSKLHDAQALLGQLHQRHGEVKQEMKTLAEDSRLAAAKFERSCLDRKIEKCVKQWQTLAVTLRMLEDIRESYEAERQPETLGEASIYLSRLTGDKYTRIWTPLGKNELRVDNAAGQPMSLDVLSRGTREAIFLSLRLALVAAYGRRGVNIPMILDDVLVNLDAKRAEATVELLCDFAKEGRQLLFFTCHEHIKQMFVQAAVDIRLLPAHGKPGTKIPRLEFIEVKPKDTLLDFVPPDEEEEIPAEVWDEAFASEVPVEETIGEIEVPYEDEEVAEVVEDGDEEDVDYVFSELDDESAFDDGNWWWEPARRYTTEEEETAA